MTVHAPSPPGDHADGSRPDASSGSPAPGAIPAFKIALAYLLISVLWILLSDRAAVRLASEVVSLTRIQTIKGWAFVFGSAVLLYVLIARAFRLKQAAVDRQVGEERRFRALIELADDVIMVLNEDGAIRYSSPSVERLIGYASPENGARNFVDLVVSDDAGSAARLLAEVLEHPDRPFRAELRVEHRDGGIRHVDAKLRSLLHDPSVGGIVVNARDVTEHRGLEQQFRQSQKMEAVGRLAGGVVHDFNNALTVIQGCGENLLEALGRGHAVARDAEDLMEAARHGQGVVRQLLAFSRRQPLVRETVDVNARIREIESVLKAAVPSRIELHLELNADPAWVRMGRDHLEPMLMNLVVNARDAMPETGELVIRTETVPAEGEAGGDPLLELTVSDTGHGIPESARENIFDPFFTTKSEGQGTGLGLAVVFGTVHQNEGTIDFETAPGRGTTFRIRFPAVEPGPEKPDAAARPAAAPADPSGNETVLVVDDEAAVLSLAARSLRKYGYTVLTAGDGVEALQVLDGEGPVDLVVTDTVMPRMGGVQLAERLGERRPRLPVLLVSGHPREEIGPVEGARFLEKPYTPRVLAARVRQILDGPGREQS